jgi:outer membrane receptor protein involved in Fe transport
VTGFRRSIWALSLVLFVASPALAFKGRVVDAQGNSLANAEIYILGRPGEAIADADGHFEWKPDPAPPFEVLVILPGGIYMKPVLIEQMDSSGVLTITVEPILSEAVLVSGSAPGIESTPAAGTTTLSASEIGVRQPSNLMQALETVAGVSQVSEGQAAVPAVRGLSGGRTLILIDGARVTSERRVGPSATFLDPAILESVDVSRGPGSVAYGSDAFGGVISVRTRRVAPASPWAARVSGMLGGAGLPEYRASMELSKGLDQGGLLFAAHTREADDWESPEGPVFNSGYSDHGALARAEHQAGPGTLGVGWQSDFGRDIERPRNNSTTVRFYYPTEDSHRFTANYDLRDIGGFQRVAVNGFLGTYDQTTDQDRFATATTGRSIERAIVSANDFHVRGFAERLTGRARFEMGLDVNGRFDLNAIEQRIAYDLAGNVASDVATEAIDNAHRLDTGVYASVDTAVTTRLTVAGGLRGDYVTTENTGGYFGDRSTSNGAASGFFAVTAGSFSGISLTAQVARGFRDPTLSDRYFRGPTGRGFITGNPDLEPETSLQYDLALRYAAPRFRVAAFYYHYDINDLIERYQTQTDFFFFRNSGQARVEGFEVESQADLGRQFTLDVAFQVSDGALTATGAHLDGIAPVTFSTQLRRQFGTRAYAQVRTAFYAEDEEPGPTERVVNGYTMLDLSGGYTIVKPLELRVVARNLLNEEYFASQDTRAVLAPGRSIAIVAAVKF